MSAKHTCATEGQIDRPAVFAIGDKTLRLRGGWLSARVPGWTPGKARAMIIIVMPTDLRGLSLTSRRLRLRAFTPEDVPEIFRWVTPSLTRFLSFDPSPSLDEFARVWRDWLPEMAAGKQLFLVIRILPSGEFVGIAGLHHLGSETPEVGIWIKEPSQRRGYGGEALSAVTKWASPRPEIKAFSYPVATDNLPSRRLAEKLGGVQTAVRQSPKYWYVVYQIPPNTHLLDGG
jgi:RimJ/RimL family protein N-acetyltransferase